MHLRQLDLGLGADTLWKDSIADEVSESLPKDNNRLVNCLHILNKSLEAVHHVTNQVMHLSGSFSA